MGCIQRLFPEAEPDMPFAPIFTALEVQPGQDVEGEIVVDAETRKVRIELSNAWDDVAPIDSQDVETTGDETVPFRFATMDGDQGRYYLRIELCGFNCNQQMVIFGLDPDINSNYERTVVEQNVTVKAESTCIRPTSIYVQ